MSMSFKCLAEAFGLGILVVVAALIAIALVAGVVAGIGLLIRKLTPQTVVQKVEAVRDSDRIAMVGRFSFYYSCWRCFSNWDNCSWDTDIKSNWWRMHSEVDQNCICGHTRDEHENGYRCTAEDCDCREFELEPSEEIH